MSQWYRPNLFRKRWGSYGSIRKQNYRYFPNLEYREKNNDFDYNYRYRNNYEPDIPEEEEDVKFEFEPQFENYEENNEEEEEQEDMEHYDPHLTENSEPDLENIDFEEIVPDQTEQKNIQGSETAHSEEKRFPHMPLINDVHNYYVDDFEYKNQPVFEPDGIEETYDNFKENYSSLGEYTSQQSDASEQSEEDKDMNKVLEKKNTIKDDEDLIKEFSRKFNIPKEEMEEKLEEANLIEEDEEVITNASEKITKIKIDPSMLISSESAEIVSEDEENIKNIPEEKRHGPILEPFENESEPNLETNEETFNEKEELIENLNNIIEEKHQLIEEEPLVHLEPMDTTENQDHEEMSQEEKEPEEQISEENNLNPLFENINNTEEISTSISEEIPETETLNLPSPELKINFDTLSTRNEPIEEEENALTTDMRELLHNLNNALTKTDLKPKQKGKKNIERVQEEKETARTRLEQRKEIVRKRNQEREEKEWAMEAKRKTDKLKLENDDPDLPPDDSKTKIPKIKKDKKPKKPKEDKDDNDDTGKKPPKEGAKTIYNKRKKASEEDNNNTPDNPMDPEIKKVPIINVETIEKTNQIPEENIIMQLKPKLEEELLNGPTKPKFPPDGATIKLLPNLERMFKEALDKKITPMEQLELANGSGHFPPEDSSFSAIPRKRTKPQTMLLTKRPKKTKQEILNNTVEENLEPEIPEEDLQTNNNEFYEIRNEIEENERKMLEEENQNYQLYIDTLNEQEQLRKEEEEAIATEQLKAIWEEEEAEAKMLRKEKKKEKLKAKYNREMYEKRQQLKPKVKLTAQQIENQRKLQLAEKKRKIIQQQQEKYDQIIDQQNRNIAKELELEMAENDEETKYVWEVEILDKMKKGTTSCLFINDENEREKERKSIIKYNIRAYLKKMENVLPTYKQQVEIETCKEFLDNPEQWEQKHEYALEYFYEEEPKEAKPQNETKDVREPDAEEDITQTNNIVFQSEQQERQMAEEREPRFEYVYSTVGDQTTKVKTK